ncbi:MAG: TetR/AcrR family transcriptional regulator [Chloroflexi bacterium]|nr:TetR/AcrR family transcriptional regulator [Chloroflexota bacterium]MCL5275341.1 TetR/AcrR family transcriptional regulator [Chloroflexota bacterium]
MKTDQTMTRGERTRAEIIQAAHALFLEKGYSGASMRQIAGRAGIALSGIYNHFAGKEDIFAAVFEERHPYLQVLPFLDTAQGENIEDVLRDLARRMVDVLNERPDFLNLLFIEMIEFKGSHLPAFTEKMLPRLSTFVTRFEAIQAREKLRPVPIIMVLRAFLGMFISYAISEHLMGVVPREYKADSLSYFIDIFLHGVIQPVQPQADARSCGAGQTAPGQGAL